MMREYINKLTHATVVVADNVAIAGENWEEKQSENPSNEESQQIAEAADEAVAAGGKKGKAK